MIQRTCLPLHQHFIRRNLWFLHICVSQLFYSAIFIKDNSLHNISPLSFYTLNLCIISFFSSLTIHRKDAKNAEVSVGCAPLHPAYTKTPRFSLSPYPRVLCVSVAIFPFLSAFVRLSSRRSLGELCGELSLFYTAPIKKQGQGFER